MCTKPWIRSLAPHKTRRVGIHWLASRLWRRRKDQKADHPQPRGEFEISLILRLKQTKPQTKSRRTKNGNQNSRRHERVEHLPGVCKALGVIPSTTGKPRKEKPLYVLLCVLMMCECAHTYDTAHVWKSEASCAVGSLLPLHGL